METKNINATRPAEGKGEKKNVGKRVGAMGGAAAVGAVGVVGAQQAFATEDVVEEEVVTEGNRPAGPASQQATVVDPEPAVVDPEPVNPDDVIIDPDPMPEPDPTPVNPEPPTPGPTPEPEPTPIEDINPDEIADAIIAEEQIDPNDIEAGEVINFDEVGMVYTVTGESYNAATFHDENGNQLMMVDVDGDELFDIITTGDGEFLVAEMNGELSMSDAEVMVNSDPTYLAASDTDNMSLPQGEDIMNDILEG